MYKGILIMNKLHLWLFLSLTAPTFWSFCGQLPEGFKFEQSSDTHRTSIISQLQRFEECNGDEKCIEQLKELERSVIVSITTGGRVKVENNSDTSVFVKISTESK